MKMNKYLLFYFIKRVVPRSLQIKIRRKFVSKRRAQVADIWPISKVAAKRPNAFQGWPKNKAFALVLRHDVESLKGMQNCYKLLELEKKVGLKSSFNFVPERYRVSDELLDFIRNNGFEVGVHGLKHDGKLYMTKKIFLKRAELINQYLDKWRSYGFYSPSAHHNLHWIHNIKITYDSSTFDIDPFEPQPDGVNTIFPFIVKNSSTSNTYIELPYTLPQDFTLFILMQETNIDIWCEKVDWIVKNNGMILLNTHPDYMHFENNKKRIDQYPVKLYVDLLQYIHTKYKDQFWHALPVQIARYWLNRVPHT